MITSKLGRVASILEDITGRNYYVISETHNTQFVGRVPLNEEDLESALHTMGFEQNPIASLKYINSNEWEEGSWRKVGTDLGDMQIHVILYDGSRITDGDSGYTYVYAHQETRWDRHPIRYYFNDPNFDADRGVKEVKRLFDEHGIRYEPIRP